jgi:hypothetical protein
MGLPSLVSSWANPLTLNFDLDCNVFRDRLQFAENGTIIVLEPSRFLSHYVPGTLKFLEPSLVCSILAQMATNAASRKPLSQQVWMTWIELLFLCGDHGSEAYHYALLAPRHVQLGKVWFGIAANIYWDLADKYGGTLDF